MLLRGLAGWGEFSPFWDYDDAAAVKWLDCAIEQANGAWPDPVRDNIPVNVIVPAVTPEKARELVLNSGGCRTAKVKVANRHAAASPRSGRRTQNPESTVESIDIEVARIAAVRAALDEAFGPGMGKIRVDANGAWSVSQAVEHLRELNNVAGGLEYAEQPCATVEELAELRQALKVAKVDVLIAADESIRRAADPYRVKELNAADIVVLKVAPLGGVQANLDLAAEIGLPVVVSSALESSIGLTAGLALAGALPELPFACGLATSALLVHDVVAEPLLPVDGELPVLRADDSRLNPLAASSNTEQVLSAGPVNSDGAALNTDQQLQARWRARLNAVQSKANSAAAAEF